MKPYHKNPRQITGKQYEQLTGTLAELGDLSGIVHDLNSDEIIGGNQRSRVFDVNKCDVVLTEQYDEPDAQGTVAHGYVIWNGAKYAYRQVRWTAKQCEKANIVANKAGGSWDFDTLANEFEVDELLDWGFEAFELGIDELDDTNAGADTEPEIDRAEELRQKWGVEPGQLWQLGDHRLICGDCTDGATVARVMGGERYSLITDPPYGIEASKMTMGIKQSSLPKKSRLSNVASWDGNRPDVSKFVSNADNSCVWGAQYFVNDLPVSGDWLCWDKKNYLRSFSEFELAWTDFDTNARILQHHWSGEEKVHITQKPLPVVEWTINLCPSNSIVFDPFCGSGTTIIACENLGRKCRAVEISPGYVAVTLERWAQHTGRTPELIDA